MTNLTNSTTTTVDARGVLGHPEHPWTSSGAEMALPDTTLSHAFSIHQIVLIWYSHDRCWLEGKVVRFRSPGLFEVEFCAGGPRLRNWYNLSHGYIRPDTPEERECLRTQGFVIVTKTRLS